MGELDDLLISTGVDSLIKIIYEKKRIQLDDAASQMGLPFHTIEEWAHVLEDQGIIRIEYQLTKIFLVWKEGGAEKMIKEFGSIDEEKATMQRMLIETMARIKTRGGELELIESEYKKLVSMFDPKIAELSERVRKIDAVKGQMDEWYTAETKKIDESKKTLAELGTGLSEAQAKWASLAKELDDPRFKLESIKTLKQFEDSFQKRTDLLKSRLDAIDAEIKKQHMLQQKVQAMGTKMDNFKKDFDDVQRIKAEVATAVTEISKKQKKFDKALEGFGGKSPDKTIESMKKNLEGVKGTLPEIRKQIDEYEKSIDQQSQMLGDLVVAYDELSSRQGKMLFDQITKKSAELEDKAASLKEAVAELEKTKGFQKEIEDLSKKINSFEKDVAAEKQTLLSVAKETTEDLNLRLGKLKEYEAQYSRIKETVQFYSQRSKELSADMNAMTATLEEKKSSLLSEIENEKAAIDAEASKLYLAVQKYKSVLSRRADITSVLDIIKQSKELRDKILKDLELISKKLALIKIVKGKEDEASKQIAAVRAEFGVTKESEKQLDVKRKDLKSLIEKMWEEENE